MTSAPRPPTGPTRVLFVCMGNICRSPLAEGVFQHKVSERGVEDRFEVDSAGIGAWHAGELADPRMRAVAARHGIELTSRARQVRRRDFEAFDHLLCADAQVLELLVDGGAPPARTRRLLEFDPGRRDLDIPDPYPDGPERFEEVYHLTDVVCDRLLDALLTGDASGGPDGS